MDSASLGPAALCVLDQHPYAYAGLDEGDSGLAGSWFVFHSGPWHHGGALQLTEALMKESVLANAAV